MLIYSCSSVAASQPPRKAAKLSSLNGSMLRPRRKFLHLPKDFSLKLHLLIEALILHLHLRRFLFCGQVADQVLYFRDFPTGKISAGAAAVTYQALQSKV